MVSESCLVINFKLSIASNRLIRREKTFKFVINNKFKDKKRKTQENVKVKL